MSLIKRFTDIVRSNVNSLIDAAEDPEKLLELSIVEMKEQEKRGKRKLIEIDALHKQALLHQEKEHAKAIKSQYDALQKTLDLMPKQIEAAITKRNELSKRLLKAKMGNRTHELDTIRQEAKDYVNDTQAFDTYDRVVEKIENIEAQSQALVELSSEGIQERQQNSERELNKLDSEIALKALKDRLNQQHTEDPQSVKFKAEQIEAELEALKAHLQKKK